MKSHLWDTKVVVGIWHVSAERHLLDLQKRHIIDEIKGKRSPPRLLSASNVDTHQYAGDQAVKTVRGLRCKDRRLDDEQLLQ